MARKFVVEAVRGQGREPIQVALVVQPVCAPDRSAPSTISRAGLLALKTAAGAKGQTIELNGSLSNGILVLTAALNGGVEIKLRVDFSDPERLEKALDTIHITNAT